MKVFGGEIENLNNTLDLVVDELADLVSLKAVAEIELDLFSKYGRVYEEFKSEFLEARLRYLHDKRDEIPYPEEAKHRHINGQISECRWMMKSRVDALDRLKKIEARQADLSEKKRAIEQEIKTGD